MPLALGLGISALSSVAGGAIQSGAAKGAANTQAQTAQQAAQLQYAESLNANNLIQSIYSGNVARLAPFVGAGTGATSSLESLTGTNGQGTGNPLTSPLTAKFQPTLA